MLALTKMRTSAFLVLGVMLMALVAACGSDSPTPTPTPTQGGGGQQPTPTPTEAPAFDAEAYFRGKTINFLVGYSPGGGTDATARYMAAEFAKFIPGNPRIVVQNIVPAPAEMNQLAASPADGLTWAMDATAGLSQSYLPQANYVFPDFEFWGSFDVGDAAWLVSPSLGYKDIRDAMGKDAPALISPVGASLPSELTQFEEMTVLLAHWLDLPVQLKTVANANSTQTRFLLFERGETNGFISNVQWTRLPQLQPDWLPQNKIQLFVKMNNPNRQFPGNSQVSAEEIADVPNAYDLLTEEQRPLWMAAAGSAINYSKGLLTTQGTPPEVVQALRDAWDRARADAAFMDGLDRAIGAPNQTYSGEETQAVVEEFAEAYDQYRPQLDALFAEVAPQYIQ